MHQIYLGRFRFTLKGSDIFIPSTPFQYQEGEGVHFSPLHHGGELKQTLRFSLRVAAVALFL